MPITIPSAALRHLPEAVRARLLDAAFAAAPEARINYLAVLDARLRVFEMRYEFPSSDLARALERGQVRDTAEVSEWLFWVDVRGQLARETRS